MTRTSYTAALPSPILKLMDESEAIWNAPGWDPSHDMDAAGEYDAFGALPDGCAELLDRLWAQLKSCPDPDGVVVPFQVAIADLSQRGDIALYAAGTESSPIVVVDWKAIAAHPDVDLENEVATSVLHELRHAWQDVEQRLHPWQEAYDETFDVEADAESWGRTMSQQLRRPGLGSLARPSAPAPASGPISPGIGDSSHR